MCSLLSEQKGFNGSRISSGRDGITGLNVTAGEPISIILSDAVVRWGVSFHGVRVMHGENLRGWVF